MDLRNALLKANRIAKAEVGYIPTRFNNVVANAKDEEELIRKCRGYLYRALTDGFVKLWEANRLDLTMEYVIVNGYSDLFTEEDIAICKSRLGM